jgi:CheY-like chemotaxis protein
VRTVRILLVEDEALLRLDMADGLRACGFTVKEASNADEAREILDTDGELDVVITDVQMPGTMDGVGLARFICEERPDLKVAIVSGAWRPGADAPAVAAFLPKPVLPAAIAQLVERLTRSKDDF